MEALDGDLTDPSYGMCEPRRITITDPQRVRQFLRWEGLDYDEAWILNDEDIIRAEDVLSRFLGEEADVSYSVRNGRRRYEREYGGFILNDTSFVVLQMIHFGGLGTSFVAERSSNDFSRIFDGGCGVVLVIIDMESGTVVRLRCNGGR